MDNPRVRAVLDAAERLIDRGDEAASIRAVAQEAEDGTSTLYEYFDSRDHVFASALERWIRDEALTSLPDGDLDRVVAAVVAQRIAAAKKHPRFVVLAAQLTLGRHGDRAVRTGFANDVALLAAHLGPLTRDLALSAREAALLIVVGVEGAVLAAVEERPQYLDDPAFVQELSSALVAAVSREPKPLPRTRALSNATREWVVKRSTREIRRVPTQARARVLVDSIFRGTERVLEKSGLDDTSTPAIAEAAGVSIGSLYQYFRDRDGVLGGLIDWWIEHDLALVRDELAKTAAMPLGEFETAGMRRMHAVNVRFLPIYRAIFSLLPRLGRYSAAQQFLARATAEVSAALAKRPDAKHIDADLTIFVTGYVWISWVRRFVPSEPEFFAGASFHDALLRFGAAVMTRAQ